MITIKWERILLLIVLLHLLIYFPHKIFYYYKKQHGKNTKKREINHPQLLSQQILVKEFLCVFYLLISFHPYHLSLVNVCNNYSNSWEKNLTLKF